MATLQFLGAAGTVTGSRHLLTHEGHRVLIDCGLFQGSKPIRERNWAAWPVDPKTIDAVVLTHAHIDHIGGLPRLVRDGFRGRVWCTPGTLDLAGLMLPDSARIQEEEARYANKKGFSKHHPALPLYTEADAQAALRLLEPLTYDAPREVAPGFTLRFTRSGHILGSAMCTFDLAGTHQRVVFTGDVGRYGVPILRDPEPIATATTLVCESTYGDRTHGVTHPIEALEAAVKGVVAKGGMLVIPAFAVGRTQELLYNLDLLERAGRIPVLPVFVDSPMACDATPIYLKHREDHDLDMTAAVDGGHTPLQTAKTKFTSTVAESRAINELRGPGVIISASGMATGGRILHHLAQRLPNARNSVLFVGYQGEGTRGRRMLDREPHVRIHGQDVPMRAEVIQISGFSAHADVNELMRWMDGFTTAPRQVVLVHGEDSALAALKLKVEGRGWPAYVPKHLEILELARA